MKKLKTLKWSYWESEFVSTNFPNGFCAFVILGSFLDLIRSLKHFILVFVVLQLVFIFFLRFWGWFYICLLVALWATRPCLWPAETKYTLTKLNSLRWTSLRVRLCSYLFFSLNVLLVFQWSVYNVMEFSNGQ